MSRKITTEQFIEEAKKVHGLKYDYSRSDANNRQNDKVCVLCPEHGEFWVRPCLHTSKKSPRGCPKCVGHGLNTDEWIIRFRQTHGNTYNYTKTVYKNPTTKIIITCLIHGDFLQIPKDHYKGNGCPECNGTHKRTTEEFINESIIIHDGYYDYIKSEYTGIDNKVIIVCPIHGKFEQSAYNHLKGMGCQKCTKFAYKRTTDDFIKEATEVHNGYYDYSKSNYTRIDDKIKIICPKHGEFEQAAYSHLKGHGCVKCSNNFSNLEKRWLDQYNIPEEYRQHPIKILGRKHAFIVDGFDPKTNIIYEFYGNFWHGNPEIYNPNNINPKTKTTFGELYEKTMSREELLKENGFKIISEWG